MPYIPLEVYANNPSPTGSSPRTDAPAAGGLASTQYCRWRFPVGVYGAKGDGRQLADGVMTNGSATLTSATAAFTAADVGKVIIVNQGTQGAQVNPLCTTITGFTNATTV